MDPVPVTPTADLVISAAPANTEDSIWIIALVIVNVPLEGCRESVG